MTTTAQSSPGQATPPLRIQQLFDSPACGAPSADPEWLSFTASKPFVRDLGVVDWGSCLVTDSGDRCSPR